MRYFNELTKNKLSKLLLPIIHSYKRTIITIVNTIIGIFEYIIQWQRVWEKLKKLIIYINNYKLNINHCEESRNHGVS